MFFKEVLLIMDEFCPRRTVRVMIPVPMSSVFALPPEPANPGRWRTPHQDAVFIEDPSDLELRAVGLGVKSDFVFQGDAPDDV